MISIKIPDNVKQDDQKDFIYVSYEDALLILMNIANQLVIEGVEPLEEDVQESEGEDLLPPHPSEV